MTTRYVAVLAGGRGERLWPLSRHDKPKQFLSLSSGKTLLDTTLQRACASAPHVALICSKEHSALLSDVDKKQCTMIIEEPAGRNTAAAIAYACLHIIKQDPDATILFMPADHIIEPQAEFVTYAHQLFNNAEQSGDITLMGIVPTYPATGYGYIKSSSLNNSHAHKVLCFKEKPSASQAQEYIAQGYLWNSGIFCGKASVFIQEFNTHAPHILQAVEAYLNNQGSYEDSPIQSIDYAIMEKSKHLSVVASSLTWSDIGNLEVFISLLSDAHGPLVEVDAHNNLINTSKKLTALLGVNDLCVVETPDVLLLAQRTKVEEIKRVIHELRTKGFDQYL